MKKPPHSGVYTRLKPSKIHGVGVFALSNIKKGTYVFPDDNDRLTWIDVGRVRRLPRAFKELYDDFSVIKGKKYGQPRSFNALTTSWYLNHSETPNMAADKSYRFYALRSIRKGEELTIDYRTYSDKPKGAVPPWPRKPRNRCPV